MTKEEGVIHLRKSSDLITTQAVYRSQASPTQDKDTSEKIRCVLWDTTSELLSDLQHYQTTLILSERPDC